MGKFFEPLKNNARESYLRLKFRGTWAVQREEMKGLKLNGSPRCSFDVKSERPDLHRINTFKWSRFTANRALA